MLIYALITVVTMMLSVFTVWFPIVNELPWGLDSYILSGFSGIYTLSEYFPPLGMVLDGFLIYMGFKFGMLIFKMIPFIGKAYH